MNIKKSIYRYTRIGVSTAFCLVLFLSSGCSEEQKEARVAPPAEITAQKVAVSEKIFQTILPLDARDLLEKNNDVLLVDVRTPQEIKQMRIEGSVAVPVGDVIRGRFNFDPDQPVLLVCAVGGRSYIAGKALASRGHRVVYNLGGGVDAWYRAGLPIMTESY